MSRIGKLLVKLYDEVNVTNDGSSIKISGPGGVLTRQIHENIKLKIDKDHISLIPLDKSQLSLSLWGTMRSMINNMVIGVKYGFRKELEIVGVGYKVSYKNNFIHLIIGKSHSVRLAVPKDLKISVPKTNIITVEGADNEKVGHFISTIIRQKPIEPFKGKGIKFKDHIIKKKEGKKK